MRGRLCCASTMPYIPSEKVAEGLRLGRTGLWVEPLVDGRIAIIAKIPESVIKALYRGAKTSLFLGVMRGDWMRILCLGLRVNDEPENPFTVTFPNSSPGDAVLLRQILRSASTTVHCLNELNHPILSASCALQPEAATDAAAFMDNSDHWLLTLDSSLEVEVSEVARNIELALDRFQGPIYGPGDAPDDPVFEIPLSLDLWPTQTVIDVSTTSWEEFRIDDADEGTKLERVAHATLDSIYPGTTFRSPQIVKTQNRRELADILSFNDEWLCVVQAKALSVLAVNDDRSSARRKAAVTKDIEKGLRQLAGALRAIRSGSPIFDSAGNKLAIPPGQKARVHAIVLVSEMYSFVDWRAVAAAVNEASEKGYRTLFHVFDIQELAHIVTTYKDAEGFNNSLIQRFAWVRFTGTAYGRMRPWLPGDPPLDGPAESDDEEV
jgi:hypothetical protein